MTNASNPALPGPPNLLKSLRAGFDAVANHAAVLIIPLILDILLWLGPHIQIKKLLLDMLSAIASSMAANSEQTAALFKDNLDLLSEAAARINLMTSLRSYPVGVPSLMASKLPIEAPGGFPALWETTNLWIIIALLIVLFGVGLGMGSLYFTLVAQAAIGGGVKWRQALRDWPRAMMQIVSLTLSLLLVLLVISIPTSCVISVITWSGLSLGQLAIFVFLGIMLWLGFPLVFTPHGIYAYQHNVLTALRNSMRVTRLTMPATSIFFMLLFFIGTGLDILWRIPPEDSWLMLVGVAGHAFIASGLLAASFVYFRDADRWAQILVSRMTRQAAKNNPLV